MKLSDLKIHLNEVQGLHFELPNGDLIPSHFHVTEIGQIHKTFIDCGGTVRQEKSISFQLWEGEDVAHRLESQKLLDIIVLSEKLLAIEDHEIEVEYQGDTISKFGLDFNGRHFLLTGKQTACLANEACGLPPHKQQLPLSNLAPDSTSTCTPGGGCC